ncbi:MAG: DUF2892 domain-containing protein [Chlamydiia bacterium]|nr:DUF2892 domain-containing protein [Chlamydiia bacterium]
MSSSRIENQDFPVEINTKADESKRNMQNRVIRAVALAFFVTIIAVILIGGGGCMMYATGLNTLPVFIGGVFLVGAGVGFCILDAILIGRVIRDIKKRYQSLETSRKNNHDACTSNTNNAKPFIESDLQSSMNDESSVDDEENSSLESSEEKQLAVVEFDLARLFTLWSEQKDEALIFKTINSRILSQTLGSLLEEDCENMDAEFLICLFNKVKNEKKCADLNLLAKMIVSKCLLSEQDLSIDDDVMGDLSKQIQGLCAINEEVFCKINNFTFLASLFFKVNELKNSHQRNTVLDRLAAPIFGKFLMDEKCRDPDHQLMNILAERMCFMTDFSPIVAYTRSNNQKNFNLDFLVKLLSSVENLKSPPRFDIKAVSAYLAQLIIFNIFSIGKITDNKLYQIVEKVAPSLDCRYQEVEALCKLTDVELDWFVLMFLVIKQHFSDKKQEIQKKIFEKEDVKDTLSGKSLKTANLLHATLRDLTQLKEELKFLLDCDHQISGVLAKVIFSKLSKGEKFNSDNKVKLVKALADHIDVLDNEKIAKDFADFDFLCDILSYLVNSKDDNLDEDEDLVGVLLPTSDQERLDRDIETLVIAILFHLKIEDNFIKIINYLNSLEENLANQLLLILIDKDPGLGVEMFKKYEMEWNNVNSPNEIFKQTKIKGKLFSIVRCLHKYAPNKLNDLLKEDSAAWNATMHCLITNPLNLEPGLEDYMKWPCLQEVANDLKKCISYLSSIGCFSKLCEGLESPIVAWKGWNNLKKEFDMKLPF